MSSKGRLVKKEKEKTYFQATMDYLIEVTLIMYVFSILVIYPLYFEDKYFNMGAAKYNFFSTVSYCFLGALVVELILWFIAYMDYKPLWNFKKFSVTDWFVVSFFVVSALSYFFSSNKDMALFGFEDWNMGLIAQTMFVLMYFFVSRFLKMDISRMLIFGAVGSCFFVCLLAVLMRFGMDPLSMYKNVSVADIEKFVSTIGQTSWYSSYAILVFALGVCWYFYDSRHIPRILSGIFVFIGTASIVTVNSDSAFVALALIFIVISWYSFENNTNFSRFLELLVIVFSAFRVVGLLQDIFPGSRIEHVSETEAICEFLNHHIISVIAWGVFVLALIWYRILLKIKYNKKRKCCEFDISRFKVCRKIIVIAAIAVIYFVILLIILTTSRKLPTAFEGLYDKNFFNFTDAWGNHRGFNWRVSAKALSHASFKDMMIGVGPDCFSLSMHNYCAQEVLVYWRGQELACAHNEFLNMAITEGILGIVSYLGIMISLAVRLGKTAYRQPIAIGFIAVILAYIGHNFFCYQTCVSTPFLFIFMGMGELIIRNSKGSNEA